MPGRLPLPTRRHAHLLPLLESRCPQRQWIRGYPIISVDDSSWAVCSAQPQDLHTGPLTSITAPLNCYERFHDYGVLAHIPGDLIVPVISFNQSLVVYFNEWRLAHSSQGDVQYEHLALAIEYYRYL